MAWSPPLQDSRSAPHGGPDRTLSPSQWAAIHADFKLAKDDGTTWVLCNHDGSTVLEKVQIVGPR